MPRQGPGGPAGVLRLPGRALAALADDEPDRERVCNAAAADGQNAEVPEPQDSIRDGAATGAIGPAEVAPAKRAEATRAGDRGSTIQERYSRSSTRRLNPVSPTFGHISPPVTTTVNATLVRRYNAYAISVSRSHSYALSFTPRDYRHPACLWGVSQDSWEPLRRYSCRFPRPTAPRLATRPARRSGESHQDLPGEPA